MTLDFEEFLNTALDEGKGEEDIFSRNVQESLESEEDNYLQEINSIEIQSIVDQIDNLQEKATHSPKAFKEVYDKLDEFEKNFPNYLIEIQSKFFQTQSQLKESYLKNIQKTQDLKIKELHSYLLEQREKIQLAINESQFEKAHILLKKLNVELLKIPQSHFEFKSFQMKEYINILNEYFIQIKSKKNQLQEQYIQKIKYILSNTKLLTSLNRVEISNCLNDIEVLLSHKKIEFDSDLNSEVLKLNAFYLELLLHRDEVEKQLLEEFKIIFTSLSEQFKSAILQRNLGKSLMILEMNHLFLKKEMNFNQKLKIDYFLLILEQKKELNTLNVEIKKVLSQEEITQIFYFAKVQLVQKLSNTICSYKFDEIEEIRNEIESASFLAKHKKSELLELLHKITLKKEVLHEKDKKDSLLKLQVNEPIEILIDEDKKKNVQKRIHNTIKRMYEKYEIEQNKKEKEWRKEKLISFIKKYIKKEKQEKLIQTIFNITYDSKSNLNDPSIKENPLRGD